MSEPVDGTPPVQTAAPVPPGAAQPTRPQASRTRPPGPFAGVPVGDYLTDVVALVLFLVSLGMPWAGHAGVGLPTTTAEYVPALVVTLLGALALLVHYLVRAGVVPGWSARQAWLVRAAVAGVYVLTVLVHVVIAVVELFSGPSGILLGPASGMAFGLAAAVLLGLPRQAEAADVGGPRRSGRLALRVLGFLGRGLTVLGVVAIVSIFVGPYGGGRALDVTAWLLIVTAVALVAAVPVLLLSSGRGSWRVAVIALGSAFVVLGLTNPVGMSGGVRWGGMVLLLPAVVAAAAHPALPWATGLAQPRVRGVQAASHVWQLVVAVAGYAVLLAVLQLVLGVPFPRTVLIAQLLLAAVAAAAALIARAVLLRDPDTGLVTSAVATGAMTLAGLALLVIAAADRYTGVTWMEVFLAFAAPIAIAYALIGPVRGLTYKELFQVAMASVSAQSAQPVDATPSLPELTVPEPSAPESSAPPVHGFTAEQAADPATPAQVLADIAAVAPELRPVVAANPSAYPGLLEWLASLGDPEVDAALGARPGPDVTPG